MSDARNPARLGVALTFGLVCGLVVVLIRFAIYDVTRAYVAAGEWDIILSYLQSYLNQSVLLVLAIFFGVELGLYGLKTAIARIPDGVIAALRILGLAGLLFLHVGYEFNLQRWFPEALSAQAFLYDGFIFLGCLAAGLLYAGYRSRALKRAGFGMQKPVAAVALVLVAVNGLATWQKAKVSDNRPNVIFLVIDALRADHLGCYGYARPTSPNIDALAKEGVVFTNCFAQSTHTKPSIASLFTSMYPSQHNVIRGNRQDADGNVYSPVLSASLKTMAEYMQEAGYNTVGLLEQGQLRAYMGFAQGFYFYDSFMVLAKLLNREFYRWLPKNKHRKFFAYLHYQDVHAPYTPKPQYAELFGAESDVPTHGAAWQDAKDDWRQFQIDFMEGNLEISQSDIDQLIRLYDAEIRAIDDQLGTLFQKLKEEGVYDNSLIIITSDHGDAFLEHNLLDHGNSLYDEVLRIPLIMRFPGGEHQGVVDSPVQMIDLLPTLLDYLNIDHNGTLMGHSVLGHLEGSEKPEPYPIYSELGDMVALRKGDYKLIYDMANERVELYNVAEDPSEQVDLSAQWADLVASLKAEVAQLAEYIAATRPEAEDIQVDPKTVENLKSLGYIR